MKKNNQVLVFIVLLMVSVFCIWHLKKSSIPSLFSQADVLSNLYALVGTKDIKITPLKGGMSGSELYKVDANDQHYVVRFMQHRSMESKKREIAVQTIASQEGWGPHLYASDSNERWIIMEYIKPIPLTQADRMNDELYTTLGKSLRKIHTGPDFPSVRDKVKEVEEKLDDVRKEDKIPQSINYELLKNIIDSVVKNRSNVITPTHRDLNPNNIIFSGDRLYIIDFEDAAQDDPFYDLGTVGLFFITNLHHEEIFLNAYFNRAPTQQELIHYYQMKQIALLSSGLGFLKRLPQEVVKNVVVAVEPFEKLLQEYNQGTLDISTHVNQLKVAISMLQEAINQYQQTKSLKIS
jgi:thiamine kinase-like enzyme